MVIDQVGLQCSEVPGKQTVPRAELYGTILAREAAGGDQALDILCDAAYVVKGASNYNADQLDAGSNGDLWHRSGMLAHQKPATAVKKIKAHAEAEVLAGKMSVLHYLHNATADAGADYMAQHLVDPLAAEAAERWAKVAYLVAKRLAVIEAEVAEATPQHEWVQVKAVEHSSPPTAPDLEECMAQTRRRIAEQGHHLRRGRTFTRCVRCQARRGNRTAAEVFARTPCLPAESKAKSTGQTTPAPAGPTGQPPPPPTAPPTAPPESVTNGGAKSDLISRTEIVDFDTQTAAPKWTLLVLMIKLICHKIAKLLPDAISGPMPDQC